MQTLKAGFIPVPQDAFSMTEFDVVTESWGKVALEQYLKVTGMVRRLLSSEFVISIQW